MITCCKGCTARRENCHAEGQCIHWMYHEAQKAIEHEQAQMKRAGNYGYRESWAVNRKLRAEVRKKARGK